MSADEPEDGLVLMSTRELVEGGRVSRECRRARLWARGLVAFDREVGAIYLYSAVHPDGYEVDTGKLKTAAQLVSWIYHLRDKLWFSDQHLADFLEVVRESCGDPRTWTKARGRRGSAG